MDTVSTLNHAFFRFASCSDDVVVIVYVTTGLGSGSIRETSLDLDANYLPCTCGQLIIKRIKVESSQEDVFIFDDSMISCSFHESEFLICL